jgi:hypothetical protein
MIHRYFEENAAIELLERRWFAALSAARDAQSECDVLLEVIELAENAWRRACTRLVEFEGLRDALGERRTVLRRRRIYCDAHERLEAGRLRV